jgi:hypothetical protein
MQRQRVVLLIAALFVLPLTGCYRKLYFQSIADRVTAVAENQKLQLDNLSLKNDVASLTTQVQTLTRSNQALASQIADFNSKTRKFDLYFRQFCCDKTTEKGADEVYIVTVGSKIGSGDVVVRAPLDAKSHWDMNDGHQSNDNPSGDSHCLTNRSLASGELKPGESYYYNVTVFEQDGGTSESYQKMAAGILAKSGNPFAVGAGTFIGALTSVGFFFKDSDDWMGMYGLKVTNTNGILSTEWQKKDGIVHINPDGDAPTDPNRKEIRMNHDGSKYVGWFGIRY